MTDPLRAELERIIDEHFDPGVMARAQAVDELLQALELYAMPMRYVAGVDTNVRVAPTGPTTGIHFPPLQIAQAVR